MHHPSPSSSPGTVDPLDAAEARARELFGVAGLYAWQRDAIGAILGDPGRALVIAPTGGGKSLTYQLPATLLEGTTLVVSPLISLMEDQVRSLTKKGIRATFLASTLSADERSSRRAAIRRGEIDLLYVAPERLNDGVSSLVSGRLALLAIDEAHCVVQWGHDFRPDYLRIGDFIREHAPARILACTATATPDTRDEILRALGLPFDGTRVVLRGFARPNLALSVEDVDGPRAAHALTAAALTRNLGSPKNPDGTGIVYAGTRRHTEKLAEILKTSGWRAQPYHAGMDGDVRSRVASEFASGQAEIIVATNAFGMGIDRPDVRVVVHSQPPASIEAYYQEVGRAGRDGLPAEGVLLIAPADLGLRRRLIELGTNGDAADEQSIARAWRLFRELLRFVDAQSCRHDFILRYFGDEAESLGGCGKCDVCLERAKLIDDPERKDRDLLVVRKILAAIARANGRAGTMAITEMLVGKATEKVRRFGFDKLTTFGVLSELGEIESLRALRACIAAGYVGLTPSDHPVPFLTGLGTRVMKTEAPNEIVLRAGRRSSSRAQGAIAESKRSRKTASADGDKPHPLSAATAAGPEVLARFEALRKVRSELARDNGFPAYVIAHDRSLLAMATSAPSTLRELAALPGWGDAKAARFGERLLSAIATLES